LNRKLIIAIDGPAGSGKSTVSRLVAKKLGLLYLDTGAMYRALTLKAMRESLDLEDAAALVEMTENTKIRLEPESSGDATKVFLDNKDVTRQIRTPELTENIKYIARVPGVRECMVKIQRSIGEKSGAVLEGRDTTTVVFPDAAYKFYLDADINERAKRRFRELKALGMNATLEEVLQDAERRDKSDQTRSVGALKRAEDAIYIDTTNLSIDEVVGKILTSVKV
jgi:cytidylate kinase